jgi:hypothetical protein
MSHFRLVLRFIFLLNFPLMEGFQIYAAAFVCVCKAPIKAKMFIDLKL